MDPNLIVYKNIETRVYSPFYLNEEHDGAIKKALQYLKSVQNEKYDLVNKNYPDYLINEIKVDRAMKAVIFETFFEAKRTIKLKIDLLSLRSRLYEITNEKNGFISIKNNLEHKKVLKQLKNEFKIEEEIDSIEEYLFSDHLEKLVFSLKDNFPSDKDVIDEFNKQLINAIFRSADQVIFTLNRGLTGQEYRGVHYMGSRSGLYIEFKHLFDSEEAKIKSNFQISVSIPDELIGRRFVIANRLVFFFHYIWQKYQNEMAELPIIISKYRKKEITVDIKDLKPWFPKEGSIIEKPTTFDSTTEKIFFDRLISVQRLFGEVQRDAEIILVPDGTIIIPDFQINYHNCSIFIEVVGFWTNNYKSRKLKKLKQLPEEWKEKLILLIDEKLDFPKTEYPTIIYKNNKFKMKEIMEYLIDIWQKPIYEKKFIEIKERLQSELNSHFKEKTLLKLKDMLIIFKLNNIKEAKQILNDLVSNNELTKLSIIKTSNDVLLKKEKLDFLIEEIKFILSRKSKFPINKNWLTKELSNKDEFSIFKSVGIDYLLNKANYRVEYQNLVNVFIYPKN